MNIILNFNADGSYSAGNFGEPLVNLNNKEVLAHLDDDLEELEDMEGYPGVIIQGNAKFNESPAIGVNLTFPLFDKEGRPDNHDALKKIKKYLVKTIPKDQSDLNVIITIHGGNSDNFSNGKKLAIPYNVVSAVVNFLVPEVTSLECTLISCYARKHGVDEKLLTGIDSEKYKEIRMISFDDEVTTTKNGIEPFSIYLKQEKNSCPYILGENRIEKMQSEDIQSFFYQDKNIPIQSDEQIIIDPKSSIAPSYFMQNKDSSTNNVIKINNEFIQ